jgi:molybdopterin-guanine dinucleotide biosynthesis protein A
MQRGAIILCGGQSSRMGADKALLPFGEETMLERVVRIVNAQVPADHTVVVAAAQQKLPPLQTLLCIDEHDCHGPLVAMARGIAALPKNIDAVFVTGCDAPLLVPEVIDFLFAELGSAEAIVPTDVEHLHPLCAVYRTRVLSKIEQQIRQGQHSLHQLIKQLDAKLIDTQLLRPLDPELLSLRNLNSHDDYESALATAGFSTP